MIKLKADPEQIQALNDGDEIVVLVRMEVQPPAYIESVSVSDGRALWWLTDSELPNYEHGPLCPVAVGDTVEAECSYCGGAGSVINLLARPGRPSMILCHECNGVGTLKATVRHIAHREQDEHYWEVRMGK